MKKIRIDEMLYTMHYTSSLREAQNYIMAGKVFVNETKIYKPGELFSLEKVKNVRIKDLKKKKYVSRGGYKLERAITYWNLDFRGKSVLDVGSSTGGFVSCALKNNAKSVTALDVGKNQLDYSLRINNSVKVLEKTNFRTLPKTFFEEKFDIITMDVSFISITLLLENVRNNLKQEGFFVCLIKPQFEAEKNETEKGIVVAALVHQKVINKIKKVTEEKGLKVKDIIESPIKGTKGNKEFLALITF